MGRVKSPYGKRNRRKDFRLSESEERILELAMNSTDSASLTDLIMKLCNDYVESEDVKKKSYANTYERPTTIESPPAQETIMEAYNHLNRIINVYHAYEPKLPKEYCKLVEEELKNVPVKKGIC